jgi:hypothetical protein
MKRVLMLASVVGLTAATRTRNKGRTASLGQHAMGGGRIPSLVSKVKATGKRLYNQTVSKAKRRRV